MVLLTTRKRLKIPPCGGGQLFKILSHLNEDPAGEAGFSFSVSMIVVGPPLKLTICSLPYKALSGPSAGEHVDDTAPVPRQ